MRKAFGDPTAIDVYVINVNGTGERNLTNNLDNGRLAKLVV